MGLWLELGLAMLLGGSAASAAQHGTEIDHAGNRSEPLTAQRQAAPAAGEDPLPITFCEAARDWCATVRQDGEDGPWTLLVFPAGVQNEPLRYPLPEAPEEEPAEVSLWPFLVREADGTLLAGVQYYRRTMYSGGGAGAERLLLLRLPGEQAPVPVLETPIGGSSMVRACFGEDDMRARRDACHDEYEFTGTLALDPAATAGRPRFILTTVARTYPGQVSRDEDSAERPPLRRRDLIWWRDPECSYTRRFAPDAAGQYAPDAPLPACSDYLDL